MKFRTPPHCRLVIHGGVTLAVAADGSIEAPEADAAHLLAHGVEPWAPTAPKAETPPLPSVREIDAMSRGAVIASLVGLGRAASPSTRTAELRRALRQAVART
ncbi:hypothetical protein [Beijerinckia sp. L45]|uniref:hypothetical protein n=1 Tax=Beijerinckia sp. L45 TaxID=1641855 RepID=UPI00131C56C8|nr:hypothetical protein [Beijerinckia sp. L45]